MPADVASVLSIIKLILLFLIMAVAVYMDVRKRTIPNILPLAIAGVSFIPPLWPHFDGIVVGLILIIVAVLVGGIGGGDIKMITAVGLCLGFSQTAMAVLSAMILLILFHLIKGGKLVKDNDENRAYPLMPFLLPGMVIGYLCYL